MDLRRRLAQLDRLTRSSAGPPVRSEMTDDPGLATGDHELALARDLGLSLVHSPAGPVWQRLDRRPDVPMPSGRVPDLAGILPVPAPRDLAWSEILFLDTETTGLAGGTGTLAFLLGLAWWDAEGFQVQQLMLPGPGREGPMLALLEQLARRFRVVATYNGASFDRPLLRTRARLDRRDDPLQGLASWDLLVGTRRCWGRRLADCRQQTIEARICGLVRGAGDIDGVAIPAAYQHYVRTGTAGDLPAVLRHNRRDMDGMAHILVALAAESALVTTAETCATSWPDAWSRALIGERRGDRGVAAAWACRLADPDVVPLAAEMALRDAIRLLKRIGDHGAVERLVSGGLRRWPGANWLHYEAAVLYEHRLGDLARAMIHAERLGDPHRCARLQTRLLRDGGCPPGRTSV